VSRWLVRGQLESYRQSYRRACPLYYPVTLTCDLLTCRVNAWWGPVVEYMCTKFGVDSSSRFILKRGHVQTDTQTQSHRYNWSPYLPIGYCQFEKFINQWFLFYQPKTIIDLDRIKKKNGLIGNISIIGIPLGNWGLPLSAGVNAYALVQWSFVVGSS